jgi:hypothetical protein
VVEPWAYIGAAIALCLLGLAARLWQLGTTPNTLNADELAAVRLAGQIFAGHGPGLLALDANGQPAISGYLQALSLHVFGDQAWALRLPAAFLGALALPCFLLVARQLVEPWAALGAAVLYGSSIYSLSVGRSGWTNDFASPLELLAIWLMLRSFTSERMARLFLGGVAGKILSKLDHTWTMIWTRYSGCLSTHLTIVQALGAIGIQQQSDNAIRAQGQPLDADHFEGVEGFLACQLGQVQAVDLALPGLGVGGVKLRLHLDAALLGVELRAQHVPAVAHAPYP